LLEIESLAGQTGVPRDFAELWGENGIVVMFVRSADWCPYCQAQLIDINENLAELTARGYGMASISYDNTELLSRFTAREGIDFPMLYDEGSRVIDAYGLRETRYEAGHRAYGVPKPIIFILNSEGIIVGKLFEEDYRTRPTAEAVVEALDSIGAADTGP
jgi:peroxiredoxin